MDTIERPAAAAQAATVQRHGLTFTSIGVEVEDAVFLDEADGHGLPPQAADSPSPFDLFPDERELAAPVATAPRTETLLLESKRVKAPRLEATRSEPRLAAKRVEAPDLFSRSAAPTTVNVKLITLFVLVATTTMFLTVRACDANRGLGGAGWTQPGR
jgi:hypothetical protein